MRARAPAFALLAATCFGLAAQAAETPHSPQLSGADADFLRYAAYDNQAEIDLCLVAEKKAASPAVQAFARLMVDDHVQVESELAALANAEQFETPNGMGPDGQKTYDTLSPLGGQSFDTAFLKDQVEDHGKDIKRFGDEAANTHDPGIRRFAQLNIAILTQHRDLAKAVLAADQSGGH
ncbi:DUF4142 domain-containing protein [Acidisoma sp. 7E03]